MNLSAILNHIPNVSNYVPKIGIASPQQAVKNLTKIAIPVIALVAVSMVNEAQSIRYTDCIINCNEHRDAHDLAKLLCHTLCLFFADKG